MQLILAKISGMKPDEAKQKNSSGLDIYENFAATIYSTIDRVSKGFHIIMLLVGII